MIIGSPFLRTSAMTDHSLFAITCVTNGHAPDDALVVGPMREVMEYIPQSAARADALEELEHARFTADQIASMQQKTRAVQATMLCDSLNHLSARLDSFLTRRADAEREEARAREEAEQQRIQAELDALPDPDQPDPLREHENTGDLHTLPAKLPADEVEFELPEPTGTVIPQPAAISWDGV
jgi:hypothetical protein